jgi:Tol biopolymer transport system component
VSVGRLVDRRLVRGWVSVAVLVVLCAMAGPAWGSFPGRNGKIVYGWTSANKYVGSPTSIRTVEPRSGSVRVLRDCPLRSDRAPMHYPDCRVSAPRYSPDGLSLAFASVQFSYPPGETWQSRPGLAMMASDGSQLEEHAAANANYYRLAWSPAGDRLLLDRELAGPDYSKPTAIFVAALDGTELSQATPDWTREPDWSSTGQIAFSRHEPDCPFYSSPRCPNVFVTRLGGTPRRLTYRGGVSPSWSPHGTKLAFVRQSSRGQDVYLVGRDGRGLRRLTYRGGYSPAWSPDGKWIAFIREGDIYVVRTNGRRLRRLVDEVGPDEAYGLGPQVDSIDWQALPRR